jgi:signal transduction histidine kinase
MRLYSILSKVAPTRKRYALKFFLVVLPLILLSVFELIVIFLMAKRRIHWPMQTIGVLIAILTVVGIISILYFFSRLVLPLRSGQEALTNYLASGEIPQLPVQYEDEAGVLLSDIQSTISKLDLLLGEKNDMIDLLSHDMRSPVSRIMNLSSLIKMDEDNSSKELYADYITNECKSLLRVLENVLLMLKEDNYAFRMTSMNVSQLINDTLNFFDFAIADKKLSIHLAIDEEAHIVVQEQLFTQAIRNIIGNAIKFSSEGKGIYISCRQEKEQISITIQDEGLGFLPADMKKIFNRFTSAGKKGTRGETSTGLGLYLSKKIVERHGGKLIAFSEGINKGATFTIVLYRLIITKRQGKFKPASRQNLSKVL